MLLGSGVRHQANLDKGCWKLALGLGSNSHYSVVLPQDSSILSPTIMAAAHITR